MKLSIKYFLTILSAAFIFTSCIKNDVVKLGDKGTPRVRIQEAPDQLQYLSPFTGDKVVDLFTLIRDEVSNSAINQPLTITLTTSSTGLDAFNTANGTDYLELLPSSFTIVPGKGIEAKGNGQYAVTFAPGVSNLTFSITINSSTWDFSGINALDFSITNSAGKEIATGKNEIVTAVGVKNKYDGHYSVDGVMVDFANATLTGNYPMDVNLETVGPNSVIMFDNDYGGYYHSILSGGSLSGYGAYCPVFNFDPGTDAIISVENAYGQPSGNGRSAELDPSGLNKLNSDKSIDVNYWMNQPSVITPHRVSFQEHFTYKGPR
ncbi:MAG: hypothetical protein JST10_16040 [Bacteroidetes bacterium]|nr:hypothetical protein [Bacteroidota bacterium]